VTRRAALEAMNRFDGPAKGIMFSRKEVTRMPRVSKIDTSLRCLGNLSRRRHLIK
jgi:hypothetical protein